MNHQPSIHSPVVPADRLCRPALTRVSAVARKEFVQIWRDPRSLGMAVAIPMLLLLLFGYALTLDVTDVPVVVWDQSASGVSRELISRFAGSRYFSVRGFADNYPDLERAIDRREALAALIVPDSFAGCVESGRESQVQFLVDGSDASTATLAIGYAELVVQTFSQEVALAALRRTGAPPVRPPLDVRPRAWVRKRFTCSSSPPISWR